MGTTGQITKVERKYVEEFVCTHLYGLRSDRLQELLQESSYKSFLDELCSATYSTLAAKFCGASGGIEVLIGGQFGHDVSRIIGQDCRVAKTLDKQIKGKSGFMDRMKEVEVLYRSMKQQGKRPRIEEEPKDVPEVPAASEVPISNKDPMPPNMGS
ncbi:hypothetical protein GOP47_0012881 [Adiantum capillus-veneris]|uniref:Uncharacterized protein n=1 Tax=Adiantum capillus-veneris TaxID=13818 RepID=A0A9D4ZGX6_ADICA|nr:hypothetical protein GOP47_0012881 [Adiantum capillus-veneris]